MSLNLDLEQIMTFFAVLVRYSILFSVLPLFGDQKVPVTAKILTSLLVTSMVFPSLVATKVVNVHDAQIWGNSITGITGTLALEVICGLVLGYVARVAFDCIAFGANLVGNFMGFASASYFDPQQESQTEVIAQFQNTLAMLIYLAIDGHYFILKSALDSYKIVGLGQAAFGTIVAHRLIAISGEVLKYGVQIAAPVAISLFSVNVAFGVMARAMPQLNFFVLSFAVSALIGFVVLFFTLSGFQEVTIELIGKSKEWMDATMMAIAGRG